MQCGVVQIGNYELLGRFARGGMADLWLSRMRGPEGFERHVLLKRVRADLDADDRIVDTFLSEARISARLHHSNVVQVHDVGLDGEGQPYIAMEYVHGVDLRQLLHEVSQRGELVPIEHVLAIATMILVALDHIHEQVGPDRRPLGLVHRDLTPGNILIAYDGTVKVADFGVAKATASSQPTEPGVYKGKVPYMSPEQAGGGVLDRRSDVFGVGILLYELVTARRLFKGGNDLKTMKEVINAVIEKPSTYRPDLSPALEAIIMRALDRDREQRFASAHDLVTALETFAAERQIRTTTIGLAGYVKRLFGSRSEPWLELRSEVDARGTIEVAPARAPSIAIEPSVLRLGDTTDVVFPLSKPSMPVERGARPKRWWLVASCAVVAMVAIALGVGASQTVRVDPAVDRDPARVESAAVGRDPAPAEPTTEPAIAPVADPEPAVAADRESPAVDREPEPAPAATERAAVIKPIDKTPRAVHAVPVVDRRPRVASKPPPKPSRPKRARATSKPRANERDERARGWDEHGLFPSGGAR